jgi:hypothetical protein
MEHIVSTGKGASGEIDLLGSNKVISQSRYVNHIKLKRSI